MMRASLQHMKTLQNEKGIALVVVLIVLVVISVMGLGLLGLSLNNMKMSTEESDNQSSYYIAESGVNYIMKEIQPSILGIYNNEQDGPAFFTNVESMFTSISGFTYNDFEKSEGQQPEAVITIEKINNSNADSDTTRDYKIISKGTIGNRSTTAEKTFHLTWKPKGNVTIPTDTSVFVNTFINLSGGATVTGAIGTNSSSDDQITLNGGASFPNNANIYVGPNAGDHIISLPSNTYINYTMIKMPAVRTFNLPPFPSIPSDPTPANQTISDGSNSYGVINNGALQIDNWLSNNYTLTMNQDMSFTAININSNETLNIDVGNNNRSLVVNNLNVKNGDINIEGSGMLTIYVTGDITMGSGSIINTGEDINKLKIYLKGSGVPSNPKSLDLSGAQKIYGSLYAEDADLTLTGGSGFQGTILTGGKNVTISGGANANTQLFYAPNADFVIHGGGSIKGSIIANSLTADGGSDVIFQQVNVNNLPFISDYNNAGAATINDLMAADPVRESN